MKAALKFKPDARWWDGLAALLLLCALLTAATRIVVTQWTEDMQTLQSLIFLGALLGLALGQSRFSPRAAFYFAFGYGLLLITWHLGAGMVVFIPWKERLVILAQRLSGTIDLLLDSKPVNDNILFLLLMSVLFWVLGVHAGFSLTRHAGSWRAVIPAGLAIMVIHAYDPLIARRVWFLAAYLLFALLLVARMHFLRQRSFWRENRTYIPPDIGFDWIRYTLVAAVLLLALAWTAPALADTVPAARNAWQRVKQPWDDFQKEAGKAFNSLQASVGLVHEQYGGSMPLSRGSALSDALVMSIEAPPRPVAGTRYYWRAYTYDSYENSTWSSTFADDELVFPDERSLSLPEDENRVLLSFKVIPEYSILTLYTPAQPVWVSVPARALLEKDQEGTADVASYTALSAVMPGQAYEVQSSLPVATVSQLREAGTEYPDWVLERYLQLPEDITPRTRELAQKIAEGLDNPYDISAAVTNFLRDFEYRELIDAPPENREILDWWLFDYQAGFCQYYASAQVVMLRSLGIPARMAVGYAQGEYLGRGSMTGQQEGAGFEDQDFSDQGGTFLVRSRESHAWPEVYFPGMGWIEFEPTAAQNPIFRPPGDRDPNQPRPQLEIDREAREAERLAQLMDDVVEPNRIDVNSAAGETGQGLPFWLGLVPAALAVMAVIVWRRRTPLLERPPLPVRLERGIKRLGFKPPAFLQRWSYHASLSPLTKAYLEINKALRRLGSPPKIDDTPAERAAALARVLPITEPYVQSLLAEYQLSEYSQKQPNAAIARQSGFEIRKLSYKAIFQALISGREEAYGKTGS